MRSLLVLIFVAALGTGASFLLFRPGGGSGENSPDVFEAPEVVRRPVLVGRSPEAVPDSEREWVEGNNRAVELISDGRLDEAVALLEQCLAALPGDETFRTNLSRALVRRATEEHARPGGDRGRGIADLERALELDPGDEPLTALLERWKRQAEVEEGFAGYESEHFSLAFDGDRDDLLDGARDVVDVLERAYSELWLMTAHDPVRVNGAPIRIVMYRRDDFYAATGLGHWAGGAYDGSIRLPVDDLEAERQAWTRTLRHELTHAFVASLGGPTVPGWLNEGFAQWFEGSREAQLASARERLQGRTLFSLDELSGSLARLGEAEAISRAYAQSLLLFDHLERFYGDRLLGSMLSACAEGSSPAERFQERRLFELDRVLEDLADELERG